MSLPSLDNRSSSLELQWSDSIKWDTIIAMKNNPRDWRIDDLIAVARQFGIECRNHGGSHHILAIRAWRTTCRCRRIGRSNRSISASS